MRSFAPFDLTAWGSPLLDAALKGLALLCVIALAALLLRRASAASRHFVWFLGVAGIILLPVLSALLPSWHVSLPDARLARWRAAESAAAESGQPPAPISREPIATPVLVASPSDLQPSPFEQEPSHASALLPAAKPTNMEKPVAFTNWLLNAWLAGAALILTLPLLGCWQIFRMRRRSTTVTDPAWCELLGELRAALRIRRRVTLLIGSGMAIPITWGAFHPVLLLPEEAAEWPDERRRVVLLHELAHIKRWDWLTQMLAQIACALHWFNPLIWYAARRMRLEREQACDDRVLASGSRASEYAAELLHFAHRLRTNPLTALAAVPMARPSSLEGRLLAILDGKRRRGELTTAVLTVGFVVLAAVTVPVAMLRAADSPGKPNDVRELLEKHRPQATAAHPGTEGSEVQTIAVDNDGKILLNNIPISIEQLEQKLSAIKAATPLAAAVVMRGDTQAQYRVAMNVLDVIGRVGISQVGLARKADETPREDGLRLHVRDVATSERLKNFRVIAGVPSGVSREFEVATGASVAAWQGHTVRAGSDGTMLWPTARAYDVMKLRVEADGYIPEYTGWLKKSDGATEIGFTLTPDQGVAGRAILPNGQSAAGAAIALSMAMRDAVLENGKLRHFGEPPASSARDQWQRPTFVTADAGGTFRLPTEIDPTAAVLIVHEQGVREISFEQFRNQPEVSLLGWGKVEGRVQWGEQTGANETVHLSGVRDGYGYPGVVAQYEKTKADARGRFLFEKVMPGVAQISAPIVFDPPAPGGIASVSLPGRTAHFEIRGAVPNTVMLGGVGRTVRGRFTGRASWEGVTFHFHPRAPSIGRGGADAQWSAWFDFQKRPIGATYFRNGLKPNADGTFELQKMLPGDYQLFVSVENAGVGYRQFQLNPEAPGAENEVVDLGEIAVKP